MHSLSLFRFFRKSSVEITKRTGRNSRKEQGQKEMCSSRFREEEDKHDRIRLQAAPCSQGLFSNPFLLRLVKSFFLLMFNVSSVSSLFVPARRFPEK